MSPLPVVLPVVYLAIHALLMSVSQGRAAANRRRVLVVDVLVAGAFLVLLRESLLLETEPHGVLRLLLLWGPVVFFWWAYLWAGKTLYAIHPPGRTLDELLIRLESRLGQPSLHWARRGNRAICEILHVGYNSYYLYTFSLALVLDLSGRTGEFQQMTFAVILGYLISYVMFALVPADGPRWALVDQGLLAPSEQRQRGYGVTRFTQRIMFDGPAHRGGAMPSSHSSTALVFLVWCWRLWGPAGGVPAMVIVVLMWLGSVYGRYHFVTDVVAGAALGGIALLLADRLIPVAG